MYKKVYYFGRGKAKKREIAAFEGLKRLGYKIIHKYQNPEDVVLYHYDFAISDGLRIDNRRIQQKIKTKANKDTLVLDLGYLKRASGPYDKKGYNQLSINACGWITNLDCPPDRFKALEMPLESLNLEDRKTILLCGQVPLDGQHNMSMEEIQAWLDNAYDKLKSIYADKDLQFVFRPHPLATNLRLHRKLDGFQHPSSISSYDVINSETKCIAAYNSTICVEALLKGIPVYCNKNAHFAELSMTDATDNLKKDKIKKLILEEKRQKYFNRLAYSQWTLKELESGLAFDFTLQQLNNLK